MLQIVASLTDNSRSVIYDYNDYNIFIIQTTGLYYRRSLDGIVIRKCKWVLVDAHVPSGGQFYKTFYGCKFEKS